MDKEFLTPEEGGDCGGVITYTTDRRIICPNTITDRINLCFEDLLPTIRSTLFPKRR